MPKSTIKPYATRSLLVALLLAFYLLLHAIPVAQAAPSSDYIWLEAEATSAINVKPQVAGWGHTEFLSGGKWLQVSIDADKVDKDLPAGGAVLEYAFTTAQQENYEVWDRIGYEFIRSPFEWRVDNGNWATIAPTQLTTDLMELQTWNEVAWLKLGSQALAPGGHKLEIRLTKSVDAQGKTEHILYASDAICIDSKPFHPNSKYKPDEDGRDATDEEAAKKVFEFPPVLDFPLKEQEAPLVAKPHLIEQPSGSDTPQGSRIQANTSSRSTLALNGLWEVCRNDEDLPVNIATPMTDFPTAPHWKAIQVPGDKNTLRPDLLFAHRLWYRTRVNVRDSEIGHSYQLVFPQNNLNTTVYVNGVLCGFNKNPFARFTIDVTKGIKPGVNEIWVGIRDAWYGYSESPTDKMKLRKVFNLPVSFLNSGFQDLAYPIWSHPESGILVTPQFVVSGSVYASDVFVKPSVSKRELAAEITLSNTTASDASGHIMCYVIDAKGKAVKFLPEKPFTMAAGAEQTIDVTGGWDDPKLWWPDDPNLYILRTIVDVNNAAVDSTDTTFGFREWTADGPNFKLNGVVWHGWAELGEEPNKEDWLNWYRNTNQRTFRFWGTNWMGMSPDNALDFFDKSGVVVRRSGIFDGEAIGYSALEQDPELKKKSEINLALQQNWRDQEVAQIKGERNHPSVMLWSIENEWLYINCINLFGSLMDQFESEVLKTSDAVRAVDPTRLTMSDGGGANKDNAMPVHGNHYVYGDSGTSTYPAHAYEANPTGGGRGRWVWDQKRPRFIGEDFFATGINPFDYAWLGGEETFQGKAQSRRAAGIITRMLTEGYRWANISAFHFWEGPSSARDYYQSNAPVAVFCRQWDWTFSSGQQVKRTLKIFNDTYSNDPITFKWTLTMGGKTVNTSTTTHHVAAGTDEEFAVTIPMPKVPSRQEGTWKLALSKGGKTVFTDSKAVSVLNTPTHPANLAHLAKLASVSGLTANGLCVYDPFGTVAQFLTNHATPFTRLTTLGNLPTSGRVLIIGKDALDATTSSSSKLAAYASAGRTVIVLEQKNPLKYQALPAEMETATNEGRIAFAEDLTHPALRGLKQKDFFTWGSGEIVYRNAYAKPTSGAKSLVQCDSRLQDTALVEVPAGKGLLLLSQLVIGEKLADNAVAEQLLSNLISYGSSYKLEYRPVALVTKDNPQLPKVLDTAGVHYAKVADPLQALAPGGNSIAVIAASPENLKALAGNPGKVKQFTQAGGWIVFNGLTPEGLQDYNKIVGVDHMIRPFRQERVTFPASKNPLTAGISTGDIVMQSGKRINEYTSDVFMASDVFSYVVDYDDIAPFAKFPEPKYFGNTDASNDHNPLNMVNGFVSSDGWQYIFSIWAGGGTPTEFTLGFPKPQQITELEWIGNAFYDPVTRVELSFDGKKDHLVSLATKPNNQPQTFPLPPGFAGKDLLIRLADWDKINKTPIIGIDNIRLKAKRSPDFYNKVKPMLNIGAMMEYPRGTGGIVLCNVLYQENEAVPENAVKKRAILATILRNLKAPFNGGKAVIAGASLNYKPIDIGKQANQYRNERGWFGDKNFTFKDMPIGKQVFAGVPYLIYDFPTSPVPTAIMLSGPNVPNNLASEVRGIPVNAKADALFFLQTARIDQRRDNQEIKDQKKYEMARYIVTYSDGQTANVPIYSEVNIDDYRQQTASALPGAQIAWTRPYTGTPFSAVAYAQQWNNPRPTVAIKSIDMVYGDQKQRGVPALLAITAAATK